LQEFVALFDVHDCSCYRPPRRNATKLRSKRRRACGCQIDAMSFDLTRSAQTYDPRFTAGWIVGRVPALDSISGSFRLARTLRRHGKIYAAIVNEERKLLRHLAQTLRRHSFERFLMRTVDPRCVPTGLPTQGSKRL
jgi:hypothetical protein